MKIFLQTSLILTLIFLTSPVEAKFITANEIDHAAEEMFTENVTAATKTFNSEAIYEKDLVILAEDITLNAYGKGDLLLVGKSMIISGEISGDVRVFGGSVIIEGIISGDLLVFGGKVKIKKEAVIAGDTIAMGGEFIHEGLIIGDSKVVSGEVIFEGETRDDLVITTQKLQIMEAALVNKAAVNQYFSPKKAEGDQEVLSNFQYSQTSNWYERQSFRSGISMFFGFWSILKFVTSSILIFLSYFIFKVFIEKVRLQGSQHWVYSGLIGIASIVIIPTISLLLMVSVIGLPIGGILLLLLWLLLILRSTLASFILGVWVINVLNHYRKKQVIESQFNVVISAIIALSILTLLGYLPYVGNLLVSAMSAIAIGATLIVVYKGFVRK